MTYGNNNTKEVLAQGSQKSTSTSQGSRNSHTNSLGGTKRQSSGSGSGGGDDHNERQESKQLPADKIGEEDAKQTESKQQQERRLKGQSERQDSRSSRGRLQPPNHQQPAAKPSGVVDVTFCVDLCNLIKSDQFF